MFLLFTEATKRGKQTLPVYYQTIPTNRTVFFSMCLRWRIKLRDALAIYTCCWNSHPIKIEIGLVLVGIKLCPVEVMDKTQPPIFVTVGHPIVACVDLVGCGMSIVCIWTGNPTNVFKLVNSDTGLCMCRLLRRSHQGFVTSITNWSQTLPIQGSSILR